MAEFDWAQIAHLLPRKDQRPPEQSFSKSQFEEQTGLSASGAQSALRRAIAAGDLDSGLFWDAPGVKWKKYFWPPNATHTPAAR